MTDTRPSAAGVFVVRDPEVCDAVAALLAPHYTGPTPAEPAGPSAESIMAAAQARVAELTGVPANRFPLDSTVEDLLDHVHEDGHTRGRQEAEQEQDHRREELAAALQRAESDLARAENRIGDTNDQLRDALAQIARLERAKTAAEQEKSARGGSARARDMQAFLDLAKRMDAQAASQPKESGDILRVAAGGVRDEVRHVYGKPKAAS